MLTRESPPPAANAQEDFRSRAGVVPERRIYLGFAVALVCMVLVVAMSYLSALGSNESVRWVDHTHTVLSRLDQLLSVVTDAETAERGYVITGDEGYLAPYHEALQHSSEIQRQLVELTADNPVQQQRLQALRALVVERQTQFEVVMELRRTQGFEAAQREILKGLGKRMHQQIRGLIDEMMLTERRLLDERQRIAHRGALLTESVTWGGGMLAIAIVALAALAIRRDLMGRERAEQGLRQARDQLELRVRQRTAELAAVNDSLKESERRFRAFVSATSDVVYRKGPDWSEMRNVQGAEVIPNTSLDSSGNRIDKYIHPDDRARVKEAVREAIRTKSTLEVEHRILGDDGTLRWIFSRAVPLLNESGEIVEWFGIASDVTARKQAETKLQAQLARLALLSQITRAIGERQDIKSIFQVVIRTLEEHLPVDFCCICLYEPKTMELTVTSVGKHSESLAIELAMIEHAHIPIDENGLSQSVQGRLVYEPDLDEAPFPFPQRLLRSGLRAFVAAPLLVETQVFGVLVTARHESHSFSSGECEFLRQVSEHVALATHQATLHNALQGAYDDLRQTQQAVMQQERLRALGQMAGGIAHDINNAISPIALYTESLLEHESELTPRTRRYLETIRRAINDVAHTVSRMREFSRPREPDTVLRRVHLNELVQQVIDLTRARWSDMPQQRGIAIEVEVALAPDLPAILGVEGELRDVLTNLIFNAVDAMPEGGTLKVRTQVRRSANSALDSAAARELVQVEVVDSGVGMDEDTRRRCFEPFFTTKGERGTGLGLAMVYGTVQRHNADIDIDSAVGKGTTIRLSFAVANSAEPIPGADWVGSVARPLRILLVDDDPIVLKSLAETLRIDGHTVVSADGGQAGIDAFLAAKSTGTPFQVVVTDLGMPQVDGRRVSAAVKAADPQTVVLLLTGWGQRMVENGDIPADVDRVLSKPPKLRELRETLAQTTS